MKTLQTALVLALACLALHAAAAPASDAVIEELMEVTRSKSLMDGLNAGMEPMMRAMMADAVKNEQLTPAQQRAFDRFPAKFAAVVREEMGWERMKPQMLAIYREVFTQEEVEGQIAFYRSPAGQAVIDKMPQVMQKTMAMSQQQARDLVPRLQAAMKEALAEAKAAE
ncbi:DUF2059 domain-containing protein [Ottowia sp.]|uniref:DUF2059 domain-containing protein n=1 Tax=Ottowia sp. TaxID=1898956 RepID=UPI0039E4001D